MKINLTQEMQKALGDEALAVLGLKKSGYRGLEIKLTRYETSDLEKFLPYLSKKGVPGLRDEKGIVTKFLEVRKGKQPKAAGAKQMKNLLSAYIAKECPRFLLYEQKDNETLAYYCDHVGYVPASERNGYYEPAKCTLTLLYVRDGSKVSRKLQWENGDCRKTAAQLLADRGFSPETDELREAQEAAEAKYKDLVNKIGLQVLNNGWGLKERGGWRSEEVNLAANGPALMVIDLVSDEEGDKKNSRNLCEDQRAEVGKWVAIKTGIASPARDEDDEEDEEYLDKIEEAGADYRIMLPVHPYVSCFDLSRHARYSCHVDFLEVYEYDTKMVDKLIISNEVKDLVSMLARSKGGFKDIIAAKAGGTTVLLAGPPGVGKTLTAEVFSETVQKPLYRVQCSQLGTDPDSMEELLLKVFSRAARWGAIILLDEADVYISKRGGNLDKNAIVGVFLRVLEYQDTALFLTTNLPESVDDAIASRCMARIDYGYPTASQAAMIWRTLAREANMKISPDTIINTVEKFPYLSGRDIKNILRLLYVQAGESQEVFLADVEKATIFHPNRGEWKKKEEAEKTAL